MTGSQPGRLSIISTPIGNLEDLSPRARARLQEADIIAAEDTRIARTLLQRADISGNRLVSYYDHNERQRTPGLIQKIREGLNVALISDAGTPLVSDPGYRLVVAAIEAGLPLESVPGPSAAIVALTVSGLPCDRFLFCGYAPRTAAARASFLREVAPVNATLIVYEGPHRLFDLLDDAQQTLGDRGAALARNLTKKDEAVFRGLLSEIAADVRSRDRVGGEMTLVIDRPSGELSSTTEDLVERAIDRLLREGLSPRTVRDIVCDLTGAKKRDVYQRILELQR